MQTLYSSYIIVIMELGVAPSLWGGATLFYYTEKNNTKEYVERENGDWSNLETPF